MTVATPAASGPSGDEPSMSGLSRSSSRAHAVNAEERILQYEASAKRLEREREVYLQRLPLYRRGFALLTIAGLTCFLFGVFVGMWGSISATFVSVAGYVMVRTRLWELTTEIDDTRRDLDGLRNSVVHLQTEGFDAFSSADPTRI